MTNLLSIKIFTAYSELSGNVDVEVLLSDGKRYVATFFTISNIIEIIERYKITGECEKGLYFWASDMIILETLSEEDIKCTILDLIKTGEFYSAFSCIVDEQETFV